MQFPQLDASQYQRILLISVTASLLIGIIIGGASISLLQKDSSEFKEIRTKEGYAFINPLIECENVDLSHSAGLTQLRSTVEKEIKEYTQSGKASFISFYLRDLNNGPWIGINENEPHSPASLIKIPLAMTIYKQAENNPEILQYKITVSQSENTDEQNIKPEKTLQANTEYTVEQLIEYMLVYSSNGAFDELNSYVATYHKGAISRLFADLGVNLDPSYTVNPDGNTISVYEYASFFRILYNSSYLSKDYSEQLLSYLSNSTFNDGINKGVPENISVAHKYGERYFIEDGQRQLHDCGIVYSPKAPYLVCIMTRGEDLDTLSDIIGNISASTYTSFTSY